MAAKPTQPPANLLNERNSNNNNTPLNLTESERNNNTNYVNSNSNNNNNNISANNCTSNNGDNNGTTTINALIGGVDTPQSNQTQPTEASQKKPTCSCTNISIMHLFHEMKQEFPTIPDPIVTQCVNENCHQREHCMQVLRNELILNPMPVQSYPAKLLIQQQQQQRQQRNTGNNTTTNTTPTKPAKPLKPTRVAPAPLAARPLTNACDNSSRNLQKSKDVNSDMPTTTATATTTTTHHPPHPQMQPEQIERNEPTIVQAIQNPSRTDQKDPRPIPQPKRLARPTTLDLLGRNKDQKVQRQQLNIELQRRLQQREQQQQPPNQTPSKPSRRAPLPPLPPKPSPSVSASNYNLHNVNVNGNATGSNTTSPISQTHSNSFSNDSSRVVSPISSGGGVGGGESEISVNVSLSSPTSATAKNLQLKSPIRHRSVITLQPEPPYTKLVAPQTTPSPGQKSFTTLNLTLRQPNSAIPPSTIDISAGPSPSGAGSGLGLTYSSTTYDGRSGHQKNFHITVTDQVGAFSASRISPRSLANQYTTAVDDTTHHQQPQQLPYQQQHKYVSRAVSQQQLELQHRQEQEQQRQQYSTSRNEDYDKMRYGEQYDASAGTLQRQKDRRDKLASALRDNKKRLSQMMNDISVLTEPISPGLDERLDSEIMKLSAACKAMLNKTDNSSRSGPGDSIDQYPSTFPGQRPNAAMNSPNGGGSSASGDGGGVYGVHGIHASTSSSSCTTPTNSTHQPRPDNIHHHNNNNNNNNSHDDDDDDDSYDVNVDDDPDEEKWSCSMCTFQNHPLLNICEQCDNVRILPGTVRIVPAVLGHETPTQATPIAAERSTLCMPQASMHSMVAATAIAAPNAMLAASHPNNPTNANQTPTSPSLGERTNLNTEQQQCFSMQQMANCSL